MANTRNVILIDDLSACDKYCDNGKIKDKKTFHVIDNITLVNPEDNSPQTASIPLGGDNNEIIISGGGVIMEIWNNTTVFWEYQCDNNSWVKNSEIPTAFIIEAGNNITIDYDVSTSTYTINGCCTTFNPITSELTISDANGTVNNYPLLSSIIAGNNITISGLGSVADPLVINGCCIADNGDGTYTVSLQDGSEFDINSLPSILTDSSTTVGFGTNTIASHDDNNPTGNTVVEIKETITGFNNTNSTEQEFISEDGTTYCVPRCIDYSLTTSSDSFTDLDCGIITGDLTTNDTPCNEGVTVYSYFKNSAINLDFISIDADGQFVAKPTDCSLNSSFIYCGTCVDGTNSCSSVSLEYLQDSASSNDDETSGRAGIPITGTVVVNDIACSISETTYELNTPSMDGIVQLQSDGSYVFFPVLGFTGITTFTYDILCNGIVQDTSTVTIIVIEAKAADDFETGLYNTTITGLDATANDSPCTPTSVTTYSWSSGTNTGFGGSVTGTPANFDYTPPVNFSGTDYIEYDILCDGIIFDSATVFLNISVGLTTSDTNEGQIDTPFQGNASINDLQCTAGASTSFHLVSDINANGSGLTEPTVDCDPNSSTNPVLSDVIVTDWNQITGEYTITPSNGWNGIACFDYFLRCSLPDGSYIDSNISTISLEINSAPITARISGSTPQSTVPVQRVCLGGNNGTSTVTLLDNGDIIHFTTSFGIDVELIIGQDYQTAAGYQNDNGSYSWSQFLSFVTPIGSSVITPGDLLTDNICFDYNRLDLAVDLGTSFYGENIGDDYLFNIVINTNSGSSSLVTATLEKMFYIYGSGSYVSFDPVQGGAAAFSYYLRPAAFPNYTNPDTSSSVSTGPVTNVDPNLTHTVWKPGTSNVCVYEDNNLDLGSFTYPYGPCGLSSSRSATLQNYAHLITDNTNNYKVWQNRWSQADYNGSQTADLGYVIRTLATPTFDFVSGEYFNATQFVGSLQNAGTLVLDSQSTTYYSGGDITVSGTQQGKLGGTPNRLTADVTSGTVVGTDTSIFSGGVGTFNHSHISPNEGLHYIKFVLNYNTVIGDINQILTYEEIIPYIKISF